MPVKHVLSSEILFALSDSGGNPVQLGQVLSPTTLYNCRRYIGEQFSMLSFYGSELTPTELPN